jgi:hypothetical protein
MKGGQSKEVGSRSPRGRGWRNEERQVQGKVDNGGFGGAEMLSNKVKVTESDG